MNFFLQPLRKKNGKKILKQLEGIVVATPQSNTPGKIPSIHWRFIHILITVFTVLRSRSNYLS